jgi:T5orf172 domain
MAHPAVKLRPNVPAMLHATRALAPECGRDRTSDRPGAVYLLPHLNRERFKVGWSQQPLHRVQQLPKYLHKQLDLAAAAVAWFEQSYRAREVERALHRSLAPYRVRPGHNGDGRTEWFGIQGITLARRMLTLLPAADGAARHARLQPLIGSPVSPQVDLAVPLPSSALDTWYRVEDLWLRMANVLPLALEPELEQRRLYWVGLRRMNGPDSFLLRSHALDANTYGWHEQGCRRSLVTLMDWESDDLLLHLMPSRQLQRWPEGDVVDQLLAAFLVGHAMPRARSATAAHRA